MRRSWCIGRLVRLDVPLMIGASLLRVCDGVVYGRIEEVRGRAGTHADRGRRVHGYSRSGRAGGGAGPRVRDTFREAAHARAGDHLLQKPRPRPAPVSRCWSWAPAFGGRTRRSAFAHTLGVSELVIGLTIVAAGTSQPEVATSVSGRRCGASGRSRSGTWIGSNIFNLVGRAADAAALVSPSGGGFGGAERRPRLRHPGHGRGGSRVPAGVRGAAI